MIVAFLKNAFAWWKRFSEAWGEVMITLLFTACYFTVLFLFFPFLRFRDPLRLRRRGESFWIERRKTEVTRETLRRMG